MKTLFFVLSSLFVLVATSRADTTPNPTPANCAPLRTAIASVTITKHQWTQVSGIWVRNSVELVRDTASVPVFQNSSSGCSVPSAMRLDNVMLNGQAQTINISANIAVETAEYHSPPNKVFNASYWITGPNARTSYASSWTQDLTAQHMGLGLSNERANTAASAHEDTIYIGLWFTDDVAN